MASTQQQPQLAANNAADITTVLDFWFGRQKDHYTLNAKVWFFAGPQQDAKMKELFEPIYDRLAPSAEARNAWLAIPKGSIALVILLDQLPRNMFRGTSKAFATDAIALEVAQAIAAQPDQSSLWPNERLFAYMCLEHSEDLAIVKKSEDLMHTLALEVARDGRKVSYKGQLRSWREHVECLEKFGRYPHRNAVLGRTSTPEELAYLKTAQSRWVRSVGRAADDAKALSASTSTPAALPASSVPQQKPMRILVLHGFRQNAHLMRQSTKKLAAMLRKHGHSLHFIESPQQYKVGFSPDGTSDVIHEKWNDAGAHQKVWWNASDDGKIYAGADKTLRFIEEVWRKEGGFDGILGFSQGATLIGILAALPKPNPISFRFAINISGYPSRADAHQEWQKTLIDGVASLNIYGARDEHLGTPEQMKAKSYALTALFKDGEILEHAGGHFTPNYWPVEAMEQFILAQGTDVPPIVDPGELQALEAKLEASFATEQRYPGAAYVPVGLAPQTRQDAIAAGLEVMFSGERREEDLTLEAFINFVKAAPPNTPIDDLLTMAYAFRTKQRTHRAQDNIGDERLTAAWLALYDNVSDDKQAYLLQQLSLIPKLSAWVDLQALAIANYKAHPWSLPARGSSPTVNALHGAIVDLFARALAKDRDIILEEHAEGGADDAADMSGAALGTPRTGSFPDTTCRLARDIAFSLRPIENVDALSEEEYNKAKMTTYIGLSKLIVALKKVWANAYSSERSVSDTERALGVLSDAERAEVLAAAPNEFVVKPSEMPVVPCTAEDLAPLLRGLRENAPPLEAHVRFARGTIIRERKVLDLCKQVVGPAGIEPLLCAMKEYESISGLLLGNNITGSKGAQEIAAYIRDPASRITTWYIAGNQFNAADIGLITDALAFDTKVTALWLKRNPLLPAGTLRVASMLRTNKSIETLDLANCGLLDDGAVHLFTALKRNRTLKHLYLNANGLTVRTAKLIGDHLASGESVLEALHLNCNPFGDDGVRELARGLAKDTAMQRLALGSLSMGAAGLNALIDALVPGPLREAAHPVLNYLNIGFMKGTYMFNGLSNYVRGPGAQAIARRLLPALPTLRHLDLCHNQIPSDGLAAIVGALDGENGNRSLSSMFWQQFGQPTSVAVEARLKALMHNNIVAWGKENLKSEGEIVEWEREGMRLLRKIECPDYVEDILSVYRTKD